MTLIKDTGERLIPEGNTQTLTYGEHISRYNAVIGICKGKVVADIASGTGYGSKMIAGVAKSVIGVDYSKEAVEYASEKYSAENLKYVVADATNTGIEDSSIDVVISLETIEHLPNPDKFIAEVKRILKKDGVFIVSTPNDDEFMDGNEFHIHEFEFKELKKLIDRNFKYRDYYFQGSWFATGIYNEESFTRAGRSELVSYKTFPQDSNTAIYFLAVASNSNIDNVKLSSNNVIADIWSTKRNIESGQMTADQFKAYDKIINSQKVELNKINNNVKVLKEENLRIKQSKEQKVGRLIIGPIRIIKRMIIKTS